MSYFDEIYEIAIDNHYLITTKNASEAGIPPVELAKLSHRGKLENLARGLYRLVRWVPDESYPYAEAVARVGEGAYLYGESVIALLELAPTDPNHMYVATPKRTRRKLPQGFRLERAKPTDKIEIYDGVKSQGVANAIPAARKSLPFEHLKTAVRTAKEEGYITPKEFANLKKEIRWP